MNGGLSGISLPFLGSRIVQAAPSAMPLGSGGPNEQEEPVPLSVSQESALISTKNPLGTLPSSSPGAIIIYTVQPGDAPGVISDYFGISLNTLLWANNIRNPNLIKVGDELIILPVSGVQYEVARGDTIESIAKKFKGDADDILSFNGLAPGEALAVGLVLIIPDGEIIGPASYPPQTARAPSGSLGLPEYSGYYMRPIFGGRKSRGIHGYNGVDLANSCGLPVLAAAEGTIIIVRNSGWNGGYGKYVVITHSNGTQTLYSHLQSVLGYVGQRLARGSQFATIGSTGNSTGCHVHFEVRGARNPF
ncbi:MAG: peptidoglycan DD-metalloendopeptidase family protein [Candidatus Sungbacteria bacterium]|nr:peptidoglycan DD-metalloendopeptidase family protein [Candidatus Sungbacteria bacterium]